MITTESKTFRLAGDSLRLAGAELTCRSIWQPCSWKVVDIWL